MAQRAWQIEGIFAESKPYHHFARARYRDLNNFQIQCYMTAIVQNIKRVIKIIFVLIFIRRYYFFNRPS